MILKGCYRDTGCLRLRCITLHYIISRRIPIAKYIRNELRDRRKMMNPQLIAGEDQRKPGNDRRKNT